MAVEICLAKVLGQSIFCIPNYMFYGALVFVLGFLIATFIKTDLGKKVGLGMVITGIVMAIGFPIIADWWDSSIVFQIFVMSLGVFAVAYFILFSSGKKGK